MRDLPEHPADDRLRVAVHRRGIDHRPAAIEEHPEHRDERSGRRCIGRNVEGDPASDADCGQHFPRRRNRAGDRRRCLRRSKPRPHRKRGGGERAEEPTAAGGGRPGVHGRTPTLAASLAHSAAALPPKAGAQFTPWGGPAAHSTTPTLAASLANSAAALPPKAGAPAPWYGPAAHSTTPTLAAAAAALPPTVGAQFAP